jgi:hypothetical protein
MHKKEQAATDALEKAALMAWTHDPRERPTARYLAKQLLKVILELDEDAMDEDNIVRIWIPPLPPNHRFTDSDFNANLEDP